MYGQTLLDNQIILEKTSGTTAELLSHIESKASVVFSYSNKVCTARNIVFESNKATIKQFLDQIFATCFVEYSVIGSKIFILPIAWRDLRFKVNGYVTDSISGEVLIAANIFDIYGSKGTVSNDYGYYSITLSGGDLTIGCSYIGYVSQRKTFSLKSDTIINFRMSKMPSLNEVPVYGEPISSGLKSTQISAINIPVNQLQNIPSFMGEVDLVKTIQLFPGVQSENEGFSGLYVRGGGKDQNLILLDEVPIYNVEHLLGFFSVFNPDAVNKVTLIKGGFPAQYGGRLSSVIDVKMYEGNHEKHKGVASIGLISSKLAFDGPLNDKTTYSVSYRRTYYDLVAAPFQSSSDEQSNYYFSDLNAKANHQFSEKSRLFFSTYWGRDKLQSKYDFKQITQSLVKGEAADDNIELNDKIDTGWGNMIGAVRWNYVYNDQFFSNATLSYSQYNFYTLQDQNYYQNDEWNSLTRKYKSGIWDLIAKVDYDYFPKNGQHIKFGANYTMHRFFPGIDVLKTSKTSDNTQDTIIGGLAINGSEVHAYFQDDVVLTSFLKLNAGIHTSMYSATNNTYFSVEPRISTRFLLTQHLSVKAAYSTMSQYVHLLSTANVSLPTDLWLPVTDDIKPLKAWQAALGCELEIQSGLTFSSEVYYKKNKNLLEYKDSQSFFDNSTNWIDKLTTGSSNAYGVEFLVQREVGPWSGWFGYTLSKSISQFPELNNGKPFRSNNDRRHDASLFVSHKFSKQIDANLTWVFSSGKPVTLPSEKYYAPDLPTSVPFVTDYSENSSERNGYSMPSIHRLDVGMNFAKDKEWGHRIWSVGVMNVYGQQNPLFLYYSDNENDITGDVTRSLNQFSLFAFPFPYVRFTVQF